VLLSNVVDAMGKHDDGVRFYIGHELGHLRMKHLSGHLLRWPVLWLPLLGAAYSRARESTCDRHGLACSGSTEGAARALSALASGSERWEHLDINTYLGQTRATSGFWMSFHELTAGYPWLTKRVSRVMDTRTSLPRRNGFAYLLAIFFPYAGRLGAGFGFVLFVYIIGVLAAVAVPAYQDYVVKARIHTAIADSQNARKTLSSYYLSKRTIPDSLGDAGVPSKLAHGAQLSLNPKNMALTVTIGERQLIFTPTINDHDQIVWNCERGKGLSQKQVPPSCRRAAPQ
jgi:Tfp pilus assembly major pilin PilA